ncbi:MAG: ketopantoate reductase family protein [Lachnospiraceae bacterium]|nr:ketopantoate reductase family protein [Lachnospiraceae bacterium]
MRLLIYGAGVIGCFYAILFSGAGYDTTIYARGKRLESFRKNGLLYLKDNKILKANVTIIEKVETDDVYDFIFLSVRENQVHEALSELNSNNSSNIVTMVNTLEPYSVWEELCGKGRIIPAFPGAGGSFEGNVLQAALTPRMIQPTTFAEINGEKTERLLKLAAVFKHSRIPYQIVTDMHNWQLCHLAMVVPIADAYYEADYPETAGQDMQIMQKTAKRIKRNFCTLRRLGIALSPKKMNLFRFVPINVLSIGLSVVFKSDFGNMFMYQHSMKASDEMRQLHRQFYKYIKDELQIY